MCGIVGFSGRKNLNKIKEMLSFIEYRGRDETIVYSDGVINLGMNRHSINDLKIGIYPFVFEDCVAIFNGEIYNYKYLKKKLELEGFVFKTNCDGEVILPLYKKYGLNFAKKIDGMFAISIFDKEKKEIILARDKFGEKPLYYKVDSTGICFASEIKVIIKTSKKNEINKVSLSKYLSNGFVDGVDTIIEGVNKIRPGTVLVYNIKTKNFFTSEYFKLLIDIPNDIDKRVTELNIEKTILKSIESRLMSDVPVGIFLSGGIDSSIISHHVSKFQKKTRAYTISFPGDYHHDELKYAKYVAKKEKMNLTIVDCTPLAIKEIAMNIGNLIDEPISDPAFLPTFLLSKVARKSVKVVLSGEGADELFFGYQRYQKELFLDLFRKNIFVQFFFRPFLAKIKRLEKLYQDFDNYYQSNKVWNNNEIVDLIGFSTRSIIGREPYKNIIQKMRCVDIDTYLSEQLLMKIDKSTMFNNLEGRVPFLSNNMVRLAFSLNEKKMINIWKTKILLKNIVAKYYGKKFALRKKHGFTLPISEWLRNELAPLVDESLLLCKKYNKHFSYDFYAQTVFNHINRSCDSGEKIWNMIVILKFMEAYGI